jgi:hypothetical protein
MSTAKALSLPLGFILIAHPTPQETSSHGICSYGSKGASWVHSVDTIESARNHIWRM